MQNAECFVLLLASLYLCASASLRLIKNQANIVL
jgi:hypothetical protein